MMRALFVLGGMVLASAHDQAACAVEGSLSAGPLAESVMNIWAATQRCEKGGSQVACAIDITSAIESVDATITIIVKALASCGALNTEHVQCGMAVNHLIRDTAGLAAEVGGALNACPWPVKASVAPVAAKLAQTTTLGFCVSDAGNSMKTLFAAVRSLSTMKADHDAHNSLKLVQVLAELGSFLAGSVAHCESAIAGKEDSKAECASTVQGMVANLMNVADVGMKVHAACSEDARLYLENGAEKATSSSSSMPLALAALLPISAVLSFVAGSRFAKARSQNARSADCEMLVEE